MKASSTLVREQILQGAVGIPSAWLSRCLACACQEWGVSRAWGGIILTLPFLVASGGAAAALLGKPFYKWVTREDGAAEWLQVVLYTAALALGIAVVRRLFRAEEKFVAVLYVLLCLGLLFLIGEELSWGQRIFGWETPEALKQIHKQQETNLHNIYGVGNIFKWVQMLVGAYGVFLPLIVFRAKGLAPYATRLALITPPYSLIPYFLLMFLWRGYRNLLPDPPARFYYTVSEYNEVIELVLALGLFLFAYFQLRKLRVEGVSPGAPAGAAH